MRRKVLISYLTMTTNALNPKPDGNNGLPAVDSRAAGRLTAFPNVGDRNAVNG